MKILVITILLLLLCSGIVLAQETNNEEEKKTGEKIKEDLEKVRGKIQEETTFEKNVTLNKYAGIILGMRGEEIGLSKLITIIAIWFIAFLFVYNALQITDFLGERWQSALGGLVFCSFAAQQNLFNWMYELLMRFVNSIRWLESLGWVNVILALLVGFILLRILRFIMQRYKQQRALDRAQERGEQEGAFLKEIESRSKTAIIIDRIKRSLRRRYWEVR